MSSIKVQPEESKSLKPLVLIIMDGWGHSSRIEGNAIAAANTPNLDRLNAEYSHTLLGSSGEAVGLPEGQMGNSEVGHLNIGTGRIVYQEYTRISKSIREGDFFQNSVLLNEMENARKNGAALHLLGLLSDGGVHSHNTHLYALLEMAKSERVKEVYVHAFLDGRDVPPQSAIEYIKGLEAKTAEIGLGKIATISGRYYAMDRDRRWERVKLAYDAMVNGEGEKASTAVQAVEQSYAKEVVDEFVKPTVVTGNGDYRPVQTGDSVIFFNFRADRARELTRAFIEKDFEGFDRGPNPPGVHFVTLTQYDETYDVSVAFPPEELKNVLADVLADQDLTQLHIAETEKYAHVTFFFNGGVETPKPGEERIMIHSPKVPTYDLKPEMSAYEVTGAVVKQIKSGKFDVIILNYANGDMVGHTGVFEAGVKAAEAVDACIGRVVAAVQEQGGEVLITADHGNDEQMVDYQTGEPHTAHTSNPVPFIYVSRQPARLRDGGVLADIAPTMLEILGIEKPEEMTGESLLVTRLSSPVARKPFPLP